MTTAIYQNLCKNLAQRKGLCTAGTLENASFYGAPLLVPGIFEFQFMRGTSTEKDQKLAKLIHEDKTAPLNH